MVGFPHSQPTAELDFLGFETGGGGGVFEKHPLFPGFQLKKGKRKTMEHKETPALCTEEVRFYWLGQQPQGGLTLQNAEKQTQLLRVKKTNTIYCIMYFMSFVVISDSVVNAHIYC